MRGYEGTRLLGTARAAGDTAYYLAEGPVWDPVRERLLWVDIMAGSVHTGKLLPDGTIDPGESMDFPDTAGAVAVSSDGQLVVAGAHRLYYCDAEGDITFGPELISGDERRFNDGKPDPAGRFVVGTKGPGPELLMRIQADELVEVIDDDLSLSNGLTWSRDGRKLYSIDTFTRRIFVRAYDPVTGAIGVRKVFARLEHGYPDGMTIDADDHLWVAVWGGACVLRFGPDGRIVGRVDVPAPHVTCPAFAGADLGTLVIASAEEGLTAEQLAEYPQSGRLFTVRPGVFGAPQPLWDVGAETRRKENS